MMLSTLLSCALLLFAQMAQPMFLVQAANATQAPVKSTTAVASAFLATQPAGSDSTAVPFTSLQQPASSSILQASSSVLSSSQPDTTLLPTTSTQESISSSPHSTTLTPNQEATTSVPAATLQEPMSSSPRASLAAADSTAVPASSPHSTTLNPNQEATVTSGPVLQQPMSSSPLVVPFGSTRIPATTSKPGCPPGTAPSLTGAGCWHCPKNTFSAGSACQSCPAFHSSAGGSSSLSDCVPDPWTMTGWSACSVSCGGYGVQTRIVLCATGVNTCDPAAKPAHEQVCNTEPCPQWVSSDYASCSVLQVRNVWCSTGTNSDCDQSLKPDESQVCGAVYWACDSLKPQDQVTCPPRWTAGRWRSSCSVSCGGGGVQTRNIACSSGDDRDCNPNTRPEDSRACAAAVACPTTAASVTAATTAAPETTTASTLTATVSLPRLNLPQETESFVEWRSADLEHVPQWACDLACPTGSAFCRHFRADEFQWPESHCVPSSLLPTDNPSITVTPSQARDQVQTADTPSVTEMRQRARETDQAATTGTKNPQPQGTPNQVKQEDDPEEVQGTQNQANQDGRDGQDGQTQATAEFFGPGDDTVKQGARSHTSSTETEPCGLWCWLLPIIVCSVLLALLCCWCGWLKRSQQRQHEKQLHQMRKECSFSTPKQCQL